MFLFLYLTYDSYLDSGGSGGERVVVSEVNDTETIVTGLTPGVLYTFSVSAENDVSSQDNNINARSLSTTANTQEGGQCIVSHIGGGSAYIKAFLSILHS